MLDILFRESLNADISEHFEKDESVTLSSF